MIAYGPMMTLQLAAQPLVFVIVGYGLIPLLVGVTAGMLPSAVTNHRADQAEAGTNPRSSGISNRGRKTGIPAGTSQTYSGLPLCPSGE